MMPSRFSVVKLMNKYFLFISWKVINMIYSKHQKTYTQHTSTPTPIPTHSELESFTPYPCFHLFFFFYGFSFFTFICLIYLELCVCVCSGKYGFNFFFSNNKDLLQYYLFKKMYFAFCVFTCNFYHILNYLGLCLHFLI